ncbi:MAG: outer membrane beta-barrel protein [Methylococcales bacterium]|nr:outer membrane beta-barrel protein [Methylococcales bacterium]
MNLKNKVILAMLLVLPTINGWAMDKGMSPGMLPLGPFDFMPLLSISESHNDNIFYNNLNRKSSLITRIQGGGELALRRKLDRYALHYAFLSSQYHSSPADNYVDHNLGATAHFDITRRNRLDFSSSLIYGHNMRGTIFSQSDIATLPIGTQPIATLLNEPDQYHQYDARANYRYGRTDAQGNLGLQLGWKQLTYDNHPERTAQWDSTQLEITPGFYWRLRPKTYLSAQIQNTFVHYPDSSNSQLKDKLLISSQDYSLRRYLMGVTWDQSSKTKGSIRAGYYQQEYSGAEQQSMSGLTWDGQVQWLPLPYSILSFDFSNTIQPSIGSGISRQLQVYNVSWKHDWPNRITTELYGTYQQVHNQNTAQGIQAAAQSVNSGIAFKFDVKYQMRSWLDIGVNYARSDFEGASNDRNSTQNIFMLYIHAIPLAVAN